MQADNACGRGAAGGRGVIRDGRYDLLRIIIADAEKEHALSVTKVLKKHGYNTMLTPNATEAQKLLEHVTPVALIMSLTCEGSEMDGFELYRRLRLFPALHRNPCP